jgi:hypothetical protein
MVFTLGLRVEVRTVGTVMVRRALDGRRVCSVIVGGVSEGIMMVRRVVIDRTVGVVGLVMVVAEPGAAMVVGLLMMLAVPEVSGSLAAPR